jgi:hypothetical protein
MEGETSLRAWLIERKQCEYRKHGRRTLLSRVIRHIGTRHPRSFIKATLGVYDNANPRQAIDKPSATL